jgi:hypothetical protein
MDGVKRVVYGLKKVSSYAVETGDGGVVRRPPPFPFNDCRGCSLLDLTCEELEYPCKATYEKCGKHARGADCAGCEKLADCAALLATYFFFVPNTSLGVAGALMTVLGLFIAAVTVVLEVYIFSLFSRFKRVPSRHNENSEEKEPSTTKANPIKATCLISGPKKLSTIEIPANATAKPRLKS